MPQHTGTCRRWSKQCRDHLWDVGVHPGEPQHDGKVLGDCDEEGDLFLMEGADSKEEGCSTMDYGPTSDGSYIKGLDVQGIVEWLGR